MRFMFGKYGPSRIHPQGVDVAFINSGYLRWVANQDFMDKPDKQDLLVEVQKELKYRDQNNCHFEADKVSL